MTIPPGASGVRAITGGDINEAYRVRMADGAEAFVKTRARAAPGEYAAEARGLRWLAEPGGLRTPRVLDVEDRWLALAWVEPGAPGTLDAERLGRGLALTHRAGAPTFGDPGGIPLARFGSVELPNDAAPAWPGFYAARRLLPLARMARERGSLSQPGASAVERVCERVADLAGPPEPPARLHGDLWSGNVLVGAEGEPWLIDPCAYGGHREVDLAMLALFGGLPARTLAAYHEVAPLAVGWRERVPLYQLLPLLVHASLFGGSYGEAAARAAARYAG